MSNTTIGVTGKPPIKSKTNWVALAIAVLGVVEVNYPLLKPMLGDWYGASFIAIGVIMAALRAMTREPLA